jgi:hypothetical protein
VGGYDETVPDGTEDWEFNIRLLRSGFRGIELAKPHFVYSSHADGILLSRSTQMHGTIWRHIRSRHSDLYRVPALVRLWCETRATPSKVSTGMAAGFFIAASCCPDPSSTTCSSGCSPRPARDE